MAEDQKTLTKVYSDNITETINLVDIYGVTKEETDNTTAENIFPNAGKSAVFIIAVVISIIIMIINFRKSNSYNDIK